MTRLLSIDERKSLMYTYVDKMVGQFKLENQALILDFGFTESINQINNENVLEKNDVF